MRLLCVIIVCVVWLCFSEGHGESGRSTSEIEMTTGRLVLRLPYRGTPDTKIARPYSFGMMSGEQRSYEGCLAGADWSGNLLVTDAIGLESYVLKSFGSNGRFLCAWKPLPARGVFNVAVTRDDYLWIPYGPRSGERELGLPIVAYRRESGAPVIDWLHDLSPELADVLRSFLAKNDIEWPRNAEWLALGPQYSSDRIALVFHGQFIGSVGRFAKTVWVLMPSDGSRIIEAVVSVGTSPILAPDGSVWLQDSDYDPDRSGTWTKFWLWERGRVKGKPLIDTTVNPEPWRDRLRIGGAYLPQIRFDSRSNTYLLWERPSKQHDHRFLVDGKPYGRHWNYLSERALLVLNREHRVITHLPWRPKALESHYSWIHPIPDGRGFYRIQYHEREAVIYFHPLPK